MKKLFISTALLLLIPIFSFGYLKYLSNSCDKLTSEFETVLLIAGSENATVKFEEAEKDWEKYEKFFAVSVNHTELDSVKQSIIRAGSYLKSGDKTELSCELSVIISLIKHIKELEYPNLQNMF